MRASICVCVCVCVCVCACECRKLSSVQSLSHVWLFVTPWTTAHQASLSITNSPSPPKLMPIESVMPSNRLILCRPLLFLPSIFPASGSFQMSQPFASGGQSIGVSASTSVLPTNKQDWLDLLAIPGTLKSLLQHHSSKASILQRSAFFIVQFSHPYMTTGKTIALTRQTFVGKVMSLLFNTLSRLVITFLPRSKHLLISWPQPSSAAILEPPQNTVSHCFHCFHWSWGPQLSEAWSRISVPWPEIEARLWHWI